MLMILAAAFWGALFYFFSDKTVESPGGYREKTVEHPGEAGITHVEDERDYETVCVVVLVMSLFRRNRRTQSMRAKGARSSLFSRAAER